MNKFSIHVFIAIFFTIFLFSCKNTNIIVENSKFHDSVRSRDIPIAFYYDKSVHETKKVVIFSHGYGKNKGNDYLLYSKLNRFLAEQGYFVVSIQHELPNDELLSMEGNLCITRLPNWKRGTENILFTISSLSKLGFNLDCNNIAIIGHSNGGDMSMLFAKEYPERVNKVITLDNRRMPFARTSKPRIYSIRGSDYPAIEGVLPSQEEQVLYAIKIIHSSIPHGQMDDKSTEVEQNVINSHILNFLND